MINAETKKEIENRIRENPTSAPLYFEYGEMWEKENAALAYLCYENAYYFATDDASKKEYYSKMEEINTVANIPKTSIVILNHSLKDMTKECIDSIIATTPDTAREIVLVDNGSTDDSADFFLGYEDVILWENDENVGFPKGCNDGIKASTPGNDILLLNNDTVMCENSLFWLRMGLYSDERHGVAGCVSNQISNEQRVIENGHTVEFYQEFAHRNNIPCDNAIEYKMFLVGFAFLIKSRLLDEVGVLDEAFGMGNYEDNDYCIRALMKGYQCVLVRNSFIIHWGSKSFSAREDYKQCLIDNHILFDERYGIESGIDLFEKAGLESINSKVNLRADAKVLCLNCGMCSELLKMKYQHPEFEIDAWGCSEKVKNISTNLSCINVSYYSDIEDIKTVNEGYDAVLLLLGLDDAKYAERYIELTLASAKTGGEVIIIMDNIRHYTNWIRLVMEGIPEDRVKVDSLRFNSVAQILVQKGYSSFAVRFESVIPTDPKELNALKALCDLLDDGRRDIFSKRYFLEFTKK